MLRLETYAAASDFLAAAGAWLQPQEVAAGLLLGLAARLVEDPLSYGSAPYFAAVVDDARAEGRNRLAALMTPPHNLILYAEGDVPEACELLARDLSAGDRPVTGTLAPQRLAEAFAARWTRLTEATARPGKSQRLYELSRVIEPRYSPGSLRPAAAADTGLVVDWLSAMEHEAAPGNPPTPPDLVRSRVAGGSVYLWDDRGPVSMAMAVRPLEHGISIAGVYTPPAARGRGYATSCVAALSRRLLDAGYEYCSLFTNLANPTPNHIYRQIGYRPVGDYQEIKFSPPGAA